MQASASTTDLQQSNSSTEKLNLQRALLAPALEDRDYVLSVRPIWPLAVHAFAAVFCMGCSALYHLMHVRNPDTATILIRLDYGGITVLIFGSTVPILAYCFPCLGTQGNSL